MGSVKRSQLPKLFFLLSKNSDIGSIEHTEQQQDDKTALFNDKLHVLIMVSCSKCLGLFISLFFVIYLFKEPKQ